MEKRGKREKRGGLMYVRFNPTKRICFPLAVKSTHLIIITNTINPTATATDSLQIAVK
jgi:hypothetical protein